MTRFLFMIRVHKFSNFPCSTLARVDDFDRSDRSIFMYLHAGRAERSQTELRQEQTNGEGEEVHRTPSKEEASANREILRCRYCIFSLDS